MSRYDKIDPKNGSYRANLAADFPPDLVESAVGVGHDANGRIVVGAGVTGVKAVLILTKAYKAGYRCDPMVSGEIVEFGPSSVATPKAAGFVAGVDLGAPGTNYYAAADGSISSTGGAGAVYVGHTVENQRLIVRVRGKE